MTIQPIGENAAALTFSALDLRGASPEAISPIEALRLTRQALSAAGLALPGPLELDAYPDGAGLLLLVRAAVPCQARPLPVRAFRRGRVRRKST